jgi:hypothetical protein
VGFDVSTETAKASQAIEAKLNWLDATSGSQNSFFLAIAASAAVVISLVAVSKFINEAFDDLATQFLATFIYTDRRNDYGK